MLAETSPVVFCGSSAVGPLGFSFGLDGELITSAHLQFGYIHRGIEKSLEALTYSQGIAFSDRVDFLGAAACNLAFAMAVERLGKIEVPERAEYIRGVLLELNRVTNHLFYLSQIAEKSGHGAAYNFCLREREKYCDLFELYAGSRLGFSGIRIGGVAENASEGFLHKTEKTLRDTEAFLQEIEDLLVGNPIFQHRLSGLACLKATTVKKFGITGPNARSSSVMLDVRQHSPYSVYQKVPYVPPVFSDVTKTEFAGDAWARLRYRLLEIRSSLEFLRTIIGKMPGGNYCVSIGAGFSLPAGDSTAFVESPRGELAVFLASDGATKPTRVKFATPSTILVGVMADLLVGEHMDDAPLAIESFDLSISEVDR